MWIQQKPRNNMKQDGNRHNDTVRIQFGISRGACSVSGGSEQGGGCIQRRPTFREFRFVGDIIGTSRWGAFRNGDRGGRWERRRASLSMSDHGKMRDGSELTGRS